MNKNMLLQLLLALIFLCSCSSVQVSQDFDSGYDFTRLKTYGWNTQVRTDERDLLQNDELLAKRFYSSIDSNLQGRGYSINSGPDFLVSCYYTVSKQIVSDPVSPSFGFGVGRHTRYGGVGIATGQSIRQYNRGQLIVEVHDPASGSLIWKGKGTHEVFTHNDPDKLSKSIAELVADVLKQFPPPQ